MHAFLSHFPSLETFTYISSDKPSLSDVEGPINEDSYWTCQALLTHSLLTLQSLVILHTGDTGGFAQYFGLIAGFRNLKVLETSINMLLRPNEREARLIRSILPESIETVRLHSGLTDDFEIGLDILSQWLEVKSNLVNDEMQYLPNLTKVLLVLRDALEDMRSGYREDWLDLAVRYEQSDISLTAETHAEAYKRLGL